MEGLELDDIIELVKDDIMSDELKTTVLNMDRFGQMKFVYETLINALKNTGAKVSYEIGKPFKTMGSISVEARQLWFKGAGLFSTLASFASNTEIYPLANDKFRLTFTFHGLTVPVDEGGVSE